MKDRFTLGGEERKKEEKGRKKEEKGRKKEE